MQYIRQHNFTEGTVIDSEQVDSEFNAIAGVLNGNIGDDNLTTPISNIIGTIYPVGSIYITTNYTNPGTLFGIGTWEAYAEGKVLVGYVSGDADFGTVNASGGYKTHSHSGNFTSGGHSADHSHGIYGSINGTLRGGTHVGFFNGGSYGWLSTGGASNDHTHTTTVSFGANTANSTIQPYTTVYMWRRTA